MTDQQGGEFGLAEPHSDPVAGDAGLRDLELGLPDAVPVADADLIVRESVDGEVLAEHAVGEVVSPEVLLPVPVGVDLVDEHGSLLAAVAVQVALAVPVDVQPPHHPRPVDLALPHAGMDRLAVPGHIFRQAHVD